VTALAPPIRRLRGLVTPVVRADAGGFLRVGSILPRREVGQDVIGPRQGTEAAINTLLLSAPGLLALTGKLAARERGRCRMSGSRRPSRTSSLWAPAYHGRSGRRSA
jgi:hypothetical protein